MNRRLINSTIRRIRKRLVTVGVKPNDARTVACRLERLLKASGLVFGVSYLKEAGTLGLIKLGYNYQASGDPWVRVSPAGWPKIFEGVIKYPEDILISIFSVARAVRLPVLNDFQVPAMVRPVIASEAVASDLMSNTCVFGAQTMLSGNTFTYSRLSSSIWQLPRREGEDNLSYTIRVLKELKKVLGNLPELRQLPYLPEFLDPIPDRYLRVIVSDDSAVESISGLWDIKQDRGMKARLFAWSPDVCQAILNPFKDGLLDLLSELCTDYTHDQIGGIGWVQGQLRQGKTCYSVDLKSATNNFPLEPQLKVLRVLGVPEYLIDTVVKLSRMPFWASPRLMSEVPSHLSWLVEHPLKWNVGQPLGLVFSFPMFALCHNALLHGICRRHNVSPDCFAILGDDIVISDALIHEEYLLLLQSSNVPVSHNKCVSGSYAEFAGAKISKEYSVLVGSYGPTTWKTLFSYVDRYGLPYILNEAPSCVQEQLKLYLFAHGGDFLQEDYPMLLKANSYLQAEPILPVDKLPTIRWWIMS
jgi:hypothetical protein